MSYDAFEDSFHDAAPVECYKFIGSFTTYRYTSSDVETTLNGEVYSPVSSKRNALRAGTQDDDSLHLEVQLPFDVEVVKDYAYAESPFNLTLELYRVHRGTSFATDWVLLWKGRITSFSVAGRIAKLRVPSIFSRALQGDLPSAYYQNSCNHVLYDGRCRANRTAFTHTAKVLSVGVNNFEVDDDGFADGVLRAGEAINSRNGERRMILSNSVNLVVLSYPFVDLRDGDLVDLVAGCDHSFATCKSKFNNALNYGGHPYVPSDNPFQGELS